ncbi:MAG TPA: tellurite resistance TerB family protein [Polyangiaceae bacterium]|jgi:tellurite resistance protein|nr:tellurite resistance TerB family protein [Polyangiaceae bacterium]
MKIETATIRRLRDALLESGRRASPVMSPAYETLARAGLLSDDERTALTRIDPVGETLFLMMAADGKVTATEREALLGAIRGLAGDVLHEGTIQVMLEQYEKTLASEGREARLMSLGATLSAVPAAAEGAFQLAAAVAMADDEVADEERALVDQIRNWFGISSDRASLILHQLDDDKA